MLSHLSVSNFYTLHTHNLTKFLLCWRVLFAFFLLAVVLLSLLLFFVPCSFSLISLSPFISSCSFSTTPAGIPPFPPLSPFSNVSSSLLTPFSSSFSCYDCKLRIWFLQSIKRVRSGRLKTKVKSTSIDYFVKSELL